MIIQNPTFAPGSLNTVATASLATYTSRVTPTGWQLYSTDTDFWNGGSQNIPTITPSYTILSGSSVTFTVPSGFNNTKVLFNMHNWGDVYISNVGMGALRYAISGSLVGGLAAGVAMTSWACPLPAGSTPRWNATAVWQLTNVTPGTYDVQFGVGRELESGSINAVIAWGTETKVEVFIQP